MLKYFGIITTDYRKALLKRMNAGGKDTRKHSWHSLRLTWHCRVSTPHCGEGVTLRAAEPIQAPADDCRSMPFAFRSLRVVGRKDVGEKVLLAHVREQALRQIPMCKKRWSF